MLNETTNIMNFVVGLLLSGRSPCIKWWWVWNICL